LSLVHVNAFTCHYYIRILSLTDVTSSTNFRIVLTDGAGIS